MREEKPKKEILTKEKVKTDLLVPAHLFPSVLLFPVVIVLPLLMGAIIWDPENLMYCICTVLLGICSVVLAFVFINILINRHRVKQGKFHIVQDTLVNKMANARTSWISYRATSLRDLLVFSVHGECFLLYNLYYKWSKLYSMRPRDVFDDSSVGDTFYLVIYDGDRKKKPVMVYNTKLFRLDGEDG